MQKELVLFFRPEVRAPEKHSDKNAAADDISQCDREKVAEEKLRQCDGISGNGHRRRNKEHIGDAMLKTA